MIFLFALLACSSKSTDPVAADPNAAQRTEDPTPAGAPDADLAPKSEPIAMPSPEDPALKSAATDGPILAAWGQACSPVPDGVPKNPSEVEKAFEEAGVEAKITPMPSCKACKMCPVIAVQIEVSDDHRAKAQELTDGWAEITSPSSTP